MSPWSWSTIPRARTSPPRREQTAAALAEVEKRIKAIPGLELRVIHAGNEPSSESVDGGGTRLFTALAKAISDLPASRIAGAVFISDGQIHDIPTDLDSLGFDAPVHLLLTGLPDEADRRLVMAAAPSFGIVDKDVAFKLRVDDGAAATGPSAARIDIMKDGKPLPPVQVAIGEDVTVQFRHRPWRPEHLRILRSSRATKELSLANNSAVALVNGVRDRLKRAADLRRAPCRRARLAHTAEIRSLRRSRPFHHSAPAGEAGRHADQRAVADRLSRCASCSS